MRGRPLCGVAAGAVLATMLALGACPTGADGATLSATDCAWPVKADPDLVNIAWPDEGAQYWAAPFTVAPGTSMRIRGHFPRARYVSFHLYEGSEPVDKLTDVDIAPTRGTNPFRPGAKRSRPGTYELTVVAGPRPDRPAPNTLYASSLNGEPNVAGVILYRIYLPEGDVQGGVALPTVDWSAGSDGPRAPPLSPCKRPSAGGGAGSGNAAIRDASLPYSSSTASTPAPAWGISRSKPQPTTVGPLTVNNGNVFFANFDNVYLSLLVWRDAGDLVALRAKAPTFPHTRGARVMGTGQVRYWSLCSNDFPSTRYVACLGDENVIVDRDGHFTIVVSDRAHRPRNLGPADNWLPAGAYPDIFLLYRQMLPAVDFAEAIERAPDAGSAPTTMGAYYPDTRVCATATFETDRCGLPAGTPAYRPPHAQRRFSNTSR